MSVKNPFSLTSHCERCPALARNRRQIVHGYGDTNADFLFIGEAPGRNGADITGVPFTRDQSGKRLQRLLIRLGLSTAHDEICESPELINCYITNVVRCNPPKNRNPRETEIQNCHPYLEQEIQEIDPAVVVPIGNFATRWVLKKYRGISTTGITSIHGRIFAGSPFTIVPMKHTARISRHMLMEIEVVLQTLRSKHQIS